MPVSGALDSLRTYFGRTAGLRLEAGAACQAESRLSAFLQAPEIARLSHLLDRLDPDGTGPLAQELLEALSCRETWFFRDRLPFDAFSQQILPQLLKRHPPGRQLRIWSAGCSSGQETYSLALRLQCAASEIAGREIALIGTDISAAMIERAQRGAFSHTEIQCGLPVAMLLTCFEQLPEPESRPWKLKEKLRAAVEFKTHNLLADATSLGLFDVIFCRNVLNLMHPGAQRIVLANVAGQLADGGYLVLGKGEEPWSLSGSFVAVGKDTGIFERRTTPLAANVRAGHLRLVSSR